MRRALASCVLLLVFVAGCTGGGTDDGDEAAPTFSPAPEVSNPLGECARDTKIGVVFDEATQANFEKGLMLAADQLNQRGSFNYEPVLVPVSLTDEVGISSATADLAEDPSVSAIVSSVRAHAAQASATEARANGVALVLVGASSDETQTGDGVFSLRFSHAGEIKTLKDTVRADLGFKDVQVASFPTLIDTEGDYIVAPAPEQDPAALMRGVTKIVGPESVVGTSVYAFAQIEGIPDGVHVGVPWYVDAPESINAAFVVDYEEAHGEKPTIDAAYGYTSVLLIARAVEAECSNERADVISGLEKTKDASSVFGRFSFTKKGEPIHPLYLLEVKNGTPTPP